MNGKLESKIEISSSNRMNSLILLEIRGGISLWRAPLILITVSYADCEFL